MEWIIEKLGWRKTSAILIILSVLAIVIIVFTFLNPSGLSSQGDLRSLPSKNSQSPIVSRPTTFQTEWVKYTSRSFELNYPSEYGVDSMLREGSSESLVLYPPKKDATVSIQSYSSKLTSASKISVIFSTLGYKQDPVIVGGVSGTMFYGSVMVGDHRLQEQAVVIEANSLLYKFHISYESDVRDSDLEEHFKRIISSFRLL
jgi:hypothetical protein